MARRYHRYRGRRGRIWPKLLIVLAILALLTVGVIVFLQNFIVYTDDGHAIFVPPDWLAPKTTEAASTQPITVEVVTAPPTTTEEVPTEPPPPALPSVPAAIYLPMETVVDADKLADAAQNALALGQTTLVLEMKDVEGRLAFQSELPMAIASGGNGSVSDFPNRIASLKQMGLTVWAKLNCFRDNLAAKNTAAGIQSSMSGSNWQDANGRRWLDPTSPIDTGYLTDLARELVAMGFDGIQLDNVIFPTPEIGRVATMLFVGDATDKLAVMSAFVGGLKSALPEGMPVTVCLTDKAARTGVHAEAGQDVASLSPLTDFVSFSLPTVDPGPSFDSIYAALSPLVETQTQLLPSFPMPAASSGVSQQDALGLACVIAGSNLGLGHIVS